MAPLFSATNVLSFEPLVDEVLECFSGNIDGRYLEHKNVFDLGLWFQYFAFDVMGTMTFSKRYSFLDEGEDIGGIIRAVHIYMEKLSPVSSILFPVSDGILK